MAKAKQQPISLSVVQLAHLIYGSIRNVLDLKTLESKGKFKFFMTIECLDPGGCIPADLEPESDGELMDIAVCHGISEIYNFLDAVSTTKDEDGKYVRAFSTIEIGPANMARFVKCLSDLDLYWQHVDASMAEEESLETKLKGKNIVKGNETVN